MIHAKSDFGQVADEVVFAPAESLVDLDVRSVRSNVRKKKGDEFKSDEFKLFDGHDGLLVRTVLVRASNYQDEKQVVKITGAHDIYRICSHMPLLDQEHLVVLSVNSQMEVSAIFEVAKGTKGSAAFAVLDVIKIPILTGCSSFIVIHNHPGGVSRPSREDFAMTEKLKAASACIGLQLVDHVIMARNGNYSFAGEGAL